jgi:outer membrane protein
MPIKKYFFLLLLPITLCLSAYAHAINLLDVYQQALIHDPIFQQAIAQRLAAKESVPIHLAALLPKAAITSTPAVSRIQNDGVLGNTVGSYSERSYQINAVITQTLFDFTQFSTFKSAKIESKQADAIFNLALQTLILRVTKAYFTILQDEDNLRYTLSNKASTKKQLEQTILQYKVGLKTLTDVYTAKAAYQTSISNVIVAETSLADDKENLRAITGEIYPSYAILNDEFPLIPPQPTQMETWVALATKQNWQIKSAQYAREIASQIVKQQAAGHLPVLNVEGLYNSCYARNTGGTGPDGDILQPAGASRTQDKTVELNLTIPLFSGGEVSAQTRKAKYNLQVSAKKLEETVRNTINFTRQYYLGVIAGVSKITADKLSITAIKSSLNGMQEQYQMGTVMLVDVLYQQEKLLDAEQRYATDRYAYINNLFALKKEAGTLAPQDVYAINAWLINTS